MKKSFCAGVLILLILMGSSSVFAASRAPQYSWLDKLKRGALNIVSSPVEVARQIQLTSQEKSLLEGWTLGLIKGFGIGFVRLGAGVVDLVTFPFNFPDDEKAPLLDPEYVWQKPGVRYTP